MRASAITGVAAAFTALAVVLSGCGSDTKTATSSSSSTESSKSSTKSSTSKKKPTVESSPAEAAGPNPSIASYIADNNITETPVHMGDPGSPTINLPVPEGWEPAGENTPEWAYGAILYTGPEAAEYTPSITAIVSKLSGDVDPQKIIDLAPGELNNLSGYKPLNEGATSTLGEYPAYQLGGTWQSDGETKVVAPKSVVIPGADGLYVLQLTADGLDSQKEVIGAATDVIDSDTTITP
jgi:hypothetical protein